MNQASNKPNLTIAPPLAPAESPTKLSTNDKIKRSLKVGSAVLLAAGATTYGADRILKKDPPKEGATPQGPQWTTKELSKFPDELQRTHTVKTGETPRGIGKQIDPGAYSGPNSNSAQAAEITEHIQDQATSEYLQPGQTVTGPAIAKYQDPPTSAPQSK